MKHRTAHLALVLSLAAVSAPGRASPPQEKVVCTNMPRAQWMSEQRARERFQAKRYLLVRFKISHGNCHEFYAVAHDGAVVEAYLHPVTGAVVRWTRQSPPATSAPL